MLYKKNFATYKIKNGSRGTGKANGKTYIDSAAMSWLGLALVALVTVCECQHGQHTTKCDCNYQSPHGYGQRVAILGAKMLPPLRVDGQEQRVSRRSASIYTLRTKADKILTNRENPARLLRQIRRKIERLGSSDGEIDGNLPAGTVATDASVRY